MPRLTRALSMLFALTASIRGGVPLQSGPNPLRWKTSRIALKVSRTVHLTGGDSGVDRRESAASVHTAVFEAVQAWAAKSPVGIDLSFTDSQTGGSAENVITFTDPAPYDSGICDRRAHLACTMVSFDTATGEILHVNIAFNPYKRFSSIGIEGTQDIGLLMLHELGHVLGLDHSAVLDSVMAAQVELEPDSNPLPKFALRQLSADDWNTLANLYGTGSRASLQGNVWRSGRAVTGAHVVAIDTLGCPVLGVLTGPDGHFSLPVAPGEYRLLVEPLDGPAVPGQFPSVRDFSPPFATLFWTAAGGDRSEIQTIRVEDGEARVGLDFLVPDDAPVNVETIGLIQNGDYWGTSRLLVARGRNYSLGLTRTPAIGVAAVSTETQAVALNGAATVPSSAPQLVRQKIAVASDAPLGPVWIKYDGETGSAVLTGALRIVTNPAVDTVDVQGTILRITGTDLAPVAAAAREWFAGAPKPTQLSGISVRVADRWAPLTSVSPTEILAELPPGISGNMADVTVISGAGMESLPVTIPLNLQ